MEVFIDALASVFKESDKGISGCLSIALFLLILQIDKFQKELNIISN